MKLSDWVVVGLALAAVYGILVFDRPWRTEEYVLVCDYSKASPVVRVVKRSRMQEFEFPKALVTR